MGRCRLALASVKLTTEFFFSTPSRRCGRANEARIGRFHPTTASYRRLPKLERPRQPFCSFNRKTVVDPLKATPVTVNAGPAAACDSSSYFSGSEAGGTPTRTTSSNTLGMCFIVGEPQLPDVAGGGPNLTTFTIFHAKNRRAA